MRVDHIVLWVEDPLKSVAFFVEVLGLEPVRVDEFRDKKVLFPSVRLAADSIIDLMPKAGAQLVDAFTRAPSTSGHLTNHICLSMTQAELAAVAERLTARGAPPQWLEKQFGAQGFTRSFYFRDLDGNVLEARSYD